MRKIFQLLAICILIFSCKNNNEENSSINVKKNTKITTPNIRNFNSDKNLMMNFYSGMNREEVKKALEHNISDSKFFIKNKNWNKDVWRLERKYLDPLSKEVIYSDKGFNWPFNHSDIIYAFSTGSQTYYINFEFKFKSYSELGNIILTIPENGRSNYGNKSLIEKQFQEIKILNTKILNIYTEKYGRPKVQTGSYEKLKDDLNKVLGFYSYKENVVLLESTFIFSNENTRMEIIPYFNNIQISYGSLSEYLQGVNNEKMNDQRKKEFEKKNFKETVEDI